MIVWFVSFQYLYKLNIVYFLPSVPLQHTIKLPIKQHFVPESSLMWCEDAQPWQHDTVDALLQAACHTAVEHPFGCPVDNVFYYTSWTSRSRGRGLPNAPLDQRAPVVCGQHPVPRGENHRGPDLENAHLIIDCGQEGESKLYPKGSWGNSRSQRRSWKLSTLLSANRSWNLSNILKSFSSACNWSNLTEATSTGYGNCSFQ